jgi:hypothetical protein
MPINKEFLLTGVYKALGDQKLTKDELQYAYLVGYLRTVFGENYNDYTTFKVDANVVAYIASRLTAETVNIIKEVEAMQDEHIRETMKGRALNG